MSDFFKDKVAIVTGASSGIGAETVKLLSHRGAKVVLAARRRETIEALARETGGLAVPTDVTRAGDAERLAETTLKAFGRIDLLVNNAGALEQKSLARTTEAELRQLMETNFFGAARCANAALPAMRRQGGGCIVNVASILGVMGLPFVGAYAASKFAMVGWSEALGQEEKFHGVHVATVCPGTVDTPMTAGILTEAARQGKRMFPITSKEVARAILNAAERRKRLVFVPGTLKLGYWLHALAPGLTHRLAWAFRAVEPEPKI